MESTDNQDDLIIKQQREIEKEVKINEIFFIFYCRLIQSGKKNIFVDFRIVCIDLGAAADCDAQQ
jgi:hypothetical protein